MAITPALILSRELAERLLEEIHGKLPDGVEFLITFHRIDLDPEGSGLGVLRTQSYATGPNHKRTVEAAKESLKAMESL